MATPVVNYRPEGTVEHVLDRLLSADAGERENAFLALQNLSLDLRIKLLAQCTKVSAEDALRSMAAVLLRNEISNATAKNNEPPEGAVALELIQKGLEKDMLETFASEKSMTVALKQASVISTMGVAVFTERGDWPELWNMLSTLVSAPVESGNQNVALPQEKALGLLSVLAENPATLSFVVKRIPSSRTIIQKFLTDPVGDSLGPTSSSFVRQAALNLLVALAQGVSVARTEASLKGTAINPDVASLGQMFIELEPALIQATMAALNVQTAQEKRMSYLESLSEFVEVADPNAVAGLQPLFPVLREMILSTNEIFFIRQASLRIYLRITQTLLRKKKNSSTQFADTGLTDLIRTLIVSQNAFEEPESEWLDRREDEADVDISSNDIAESLHTLLAEFMVHTHGSGAVEILRAACAEMQANAPYPTRVAALRVIAAVVPFAAAADQAASNEFFCLLVRSLGAAEMTDPRLRWWILYVITCQLSEDAVSLAVLQSQAADVLLHLGRIGRDDPTHRCKCRALACLFAFLNSLQGYEEDTADEISALKDPPATLDGATGPQAATIMEPFVEPLLQDVLVPAIESTNDELQTLGFGILVALAGVLHDRFLPYYKPCFVAVTNSLNCGINLICDENTTAAQQRRGLALCEGAVNLGRKLIEILPPDTTANDSPGLLSVITNTLERVMAVVDADSTLDGSGVICGALRAIGTVATKVDSEVLCAYTPGLITAVRRVLSQTDIISCAGTGAPAPPSVPGSLPGAGGVLNLHDLSRIKAGHVDISEANGVTEIGIKDVGGEKRIVRVKTAAIQEKIDALACLNDVICSCGYGFVPFVPQVLDALKAEASGHYTLIRIPAINCLKALVNCFLPSAAETEVPRLHSKCPIATGAVKTSDFCQLVLSILHSLLPLAAESATGQAAEILPVVNELFEALVEATYFTPNTPFLFDTAQFLEFCFSNFGKRMILTITTAVERPNQKKEHGTSRSSTTDEEEDAWNDVSSDETEDEDLSIEADGIVYFEVMRCSRNLLKLFGIEACTLLWFQHLSTAFTGLLALPSSIGQAAALCSYGVLLEFSQTNAVADPIAQTAADTLPLALYFAKSGGELNTADSADSADAVRVQGACYLLGEIARRLPNIFVKEGSAAFVALRQITLHPYAHSEDRKAATECATGALIKIFTASPLQWFLEKEIGSNEAIVQNFRTLILRELPFTEDMDESCTVANVFLDTIEHSKGPLSDVCMFGLQLILQGIAKENNPHLMLKEQRLHPVVVALGATGNLLPQASEVS